MDIPETLATLGTQYTGRRQTKPHKNSTQKTINNPTKNLGWTQGLAKDKQFLPFIGHTSFSPIMYWYMKCLYSQSQKDYLMCYSEENLQSIIKQTCFSLSIWSSTVLTLSRYLKWSSNNLSTCQKRKKMFTEFIWH
jgi:hypothetical protein